jgi:hypothetical protein
VRLFESADRLQTVRAHLYVYLFIFVLVSFNLLFEDFVVVVINNV